VNPQTERFSRDTGFQPVQNTLKSAAIFVLRAFSTGYKPVSRGKAKAGKCGDFQAYPEKPRSLSKSATWLL
jgi:hypothetical protein